MKGGDSIVLTGKVEIVSDMEIKKALWSDWMFAHFPGGVIDPSYCILKFTSEEATYWIDNEFVKASPFSGGLAAERTKLLQLAEKIVTENYKLLVTE